MRLSLCIVVAALLAFLLTQEAIAKPPSVGSIKHLGELPQWRHVGLKLDRDLIIERKKSLIYKLVDKDQWLIPAGVTGLSHAVRMEGKEYFMLRYSTRAPGAAHAEHNFLRAAPIAGGCASERVSTLLVDAETLQVYPSVLQVKRSTCSAKETLEWRSERVSLDLAPFAGKRYRDEAEYQAALLQHEKAVQDAGRAEMEAAWDKEQRTLPRKRQIGARLCRDEGRWQFVGFTEGVSPDNGKVQIRVIGQHAAGSPSLQAGGFKEHIIWDAPEAWSLCE